MELSKELYIKANEDASDSRIVLVSTTNHDSAAIPGAARWSLEQLKELVKQMEALKDARVRATEVYTNALKV